MNGPEIRSPQNSLRFGIAILVIVIALLGLTSWKVEAQSRSANCGGEGQRPCTVTSAVFQGKKPNTCPANSFYDPINGGSCWNCPSGYNRTVFAVNGSQACERTGQTEFSSATRRNRGSGFLGTTCPSGQFWDPNGYCWSCPSGYTRTSNSVTGGLACSRWVPAARTRATLRTSLVCPSGSFFDSVDGGTCWSCPRGFSRTLSSVKANDACEAAPLAGVSADFGACRTGYVNINGRCYQRNNCGKEGQRPCLLGEKTPSCNSGLKETFNTNRCEKLRPGETPFTAGLSSLSAVTADVIQTSCTNLGSFVRFPNKTVAEIGANCTKDVFVGASCAYIASELGAGVLETVSTAFETGPFAAQFAREVDSAYNGTCAAFEEKTTFATRIKTASKPNGQDCPSGSFWDPNGSCYTCPAGYTRTLEPVTGSRACVDKVAGELARVLCSTGAATAKVFGGGVSCVVDLLSDPTFMDRKLEFSKVDTEVCLATGEFTYTMVDLFADFKEPPTAKATKAQSRLAKFIAKIKNSDMYRTASVISTTAPATADLTNAWIDLPACNPSPPTR
jgi:hypothetical protein